MSVLGRQFEGHPYERQIGMVPTSELLSRQGNPEYHRREEGKVQSHMESIQREGFKNPVVLGYNPKNGHGVLVDGHHRVEAAHRLGIRAVPTRGYRNNYLDASDGGRSGLPVREGYVPQDLHPRDIGLPTAE